MTDEPGAVEGASAKKEFSTARKGYDPAEVDEYLAEFDVAFGELEDYAARLKRELSEARLENARLATAEQDSVDAAMLAVFEAKERIMDRAMAKASEIENQARSAAGLPTPAVESSPVVEAEDSDSAVGNELLSELSKLIGEESPGEIQPNDVLQQMLQEADTIRNRLDDGLTAAFDQMEQMQREAELRATALLADARQEAVRLRTTAGADSSSADTKIEVKISGDDDETGRERQSRYSRNSAALPRIGDDDGPSVLAAMNGLRNKLRESEKADREVQSSSDA